MVVPVSNRAASVESFKVMDVLRRANELQAQGKRVFHCEVGQPETGAPQIVAQAAIDAIQSNHHTIDTTNTDSTTAATPTTSTVSNKTKNVMGYTDSFGLLELRTKIVEHYQKKYFSDTTNTIIPTNLSIDQIVITTGSSGAFLLAFTACFDVNDVVAIASSGYPCYRNILQALGCTICYIPINEQFKLTAYELQKEIQYRINHQLPPIKGLILSSPSNPTGAMLTPEELQALCHVTDQYNIQFLSDEIYHGISYSIPETTAIQYSDNAVVINSFSKYYSMSGWRLGWMIIPKSLIEPINSLQQNMFINAPTISQTAAIHCWDDNCIIELEQHVTKYRCSRSYILQELEHITEIDAQNIAPADGGFYIYIDLGEENVSHELGSTEMCQCLLEEQCVAFTPGIDFEDPNTNLGQRRFRISYSQGVDVVKEAMERFHIFFPTWIERVRISKSNNVQVSK